MQRYFFILLLSFLPLIGQAASTPLEASRDSLLMLFNHAAQGPRQIELLTHLSDIGITLNDHTYTEKLWVEALRQKETKALYISGVYFTLHYLNLAQLDSAQVWMERCHKQLIGEEREQTLAYLELMSEIRNPDEREALAHRLLNDYDRQKKEENLFLKMKRLYQLGVLALYDWNANTTIKMKSWDSYMREGYALALKLPIRQSYRFRHQFLMSLSTMNPDYVTALLQLQADYLALPEMSNRPFYSHTTEIVACARMLKHGDVIGREQMDHYFALFKELTTRYPHDSPTPLDIFYYYTALSYYNYTHDYANAVMCCDSFIINAPKYKMDNTYQYEQKGEFLALMGRYKEAYETSKSYLSIKDSLMSASTAGQLMELETRYNVDRISFEHERQRMWTLISLCGCLLLVGVLVALIYHYRRIQQKNSTLVNRIRKQEAAEKQVDAVQKVRPTETLSADELLFRQIEQLLEDKELLRLPNLGRGEIPARVCSNRTSVGNAIRNCTQEGYTISEYLNRKRAKYACELLEFRLDLSVETVGEFCGFSRSNYFSTFKSIYDLTPGDFRKAMLRSAPQITPICTD